MRKFKTVPILSASTCPAMVLAQVTLAAAPASNIHALRLGAVRGTES